MLKLQTNLDKNCKQQNIRVGHKKSLQLGVVGVIGEKWSTRGTEGTRPQEGKDCCEIIDNGARIKEVIFM